jgi:solute carrier family 6 (neurotransmitter transporter, serotonin) member 4
MSGSVVLSIIFFIMLITLGKHKNINFPAYPCELCAISGLDSTFGGLEAMITALCDEYPRTLGKNREKFVAGLLVFIYICSLPTCTYVSIIQAKVWFK